MGSKRQFLLESLWPAQIYLILLNRSIICMHSTQKVLYMFNGCLPCSMGFNLAFHISSEFPVVCSRSLTAFSRPGKELLKSVPIFLLFSARGGWRLAPAVLAHEDSQKHLVRTHWNACFGTWLPCSFQGGRVIQEGKSRVKNLWIPRMFC